MKSFRLICVLCLCGILSPFPARALTGMDMWQEYLGNDTYKFYVGGYVNCTEFQYQSFMPPFPGGNIPSPISVSFASAAFCTISSSSGWVMETWLEVSPLCPGVSSYCQDQTFSGFSQAYFRQSRVMVISNCSSTPGVEDIQLNTGFCCRPLATTSIANANVVGSFMRHRFFSQIPNSSPQFEPVNLSICDSDTSSFFVGGFDPDGDSLVYEMVPSMINEAIPVTYKVGYSFTQPLGANWTVDLDSHSGILTFIPNPGGMQMGFIRIRVTEYRNGQFAGVTERDLMATVRACSGNSTPQISGIQNATGGIQQAETEISFCQGVPLSFDIHISDPDPGQFLQLTHNISKVLPNATIQQNGINPVSLTITWTPGAADTLEKAIYLTSFDSNCPYIGTSSKVYTFSPNGPCLVSTLTSSNCQDSTGSISAFVLNATGPLGYSWSTGASDSVISGLPDGVYWVSITDSQSQLVFSDTFFLTSDILQLSAAVSGPGCADSTGSIHLSVSGGSPPYTFVWNTNATDSVLQQIPKGGYHVLVNDSSGCYRDSTFLVEPVSSCGALYSGVVYLDGNQNCQLDSAEVGIPGVLVASSQGTMAMTDASGRFSMELNAGTVLIEVVSSPGAAVCPGIYFGNGSSFGLADSLVHFGIDSGNFPVNDLELTLSSAAHVWNGSVRYFLTGKNRGILATTGSFMGLEANEGLSPTKFGKEPSVIDTFENTYGWTVPPLQPYQIFTTLVDFDLGPALNLNDTVEVKGWVSFLPFEDSTNNQIDRDYRVVGSYDPNDKLVTPAGIGEEGFILPTTADLDYTIRFQNTGNYPASYVVLRDTLSPLLKLSGFRQLGHSHPYSLVVEEDSIMVFTFANINLPDSASDPLGSQGFVAFRLGLAGSLPIGTEIRNRAAIYFDFNPPIITNTVLNTIYTQPVVKIQEKSPYCVGGKITAEITATGKAPYTFAWHQGKQTTTTAVTDTLLSFQNGWYSVTVTDEFGFQATDSVLVDISPSPVSQFTWDFGGNGLVVFFRDSSLNGDSYLWDFGNGIQSIEQNPVLAFSRSGIYEIMLVVSNACGSDTSRATIQLIADGLDAWPYGEVRVMPNPLEDYTTVTFPFSGAWTLSLSDLRGKTLWQTAVQGQEYRFDGTSLPGGVYLLEVSDGRARMVKRLVVE